MPSFVTKVTTMIPTLHGSQGGVFRTADLVLPEAESAVLRERGRAPTDVRLAESMTSGFQCAGCGEWNETVVDASVGMRQSYMEDRFAASRMSSESNGTGSLGST